MKSRVESLLLKESIMARIVVIAAFAALTFVAGVVSTSVRTEKSNPPGAKICQCDLAGGCCCEKCPCTDLRTKKK